MANLELQSRLHVLNGLIVPIFVKQENLDRMRSMTLCNDDVWVISFPKSGTTWTRYMVHLIQHKGEGDMKNIDDAVLYLEAGSHHSLVTADDLVATAQSI